ncbi:hypothetical protein QWY31_08160 [Cytophagales bacterium LB-30]|uniref:Prepilin type IV endopeptidase peptidase domain-containing protein n=1 Tax=Shiella aurantiaca TaxID=3058365 RepID=A0ABT8F501_9BACT|nr:hypothetical protein [Shiella aurantiaca]MDN4165470.1 hypothetical protein [Shiella aurantiaca]
MLNTTQLAFLLIPIAIIAFQDFKYRAVHVLAFLLLLTGVAYTLYDWEVWRPIDILLNNLFIGINLSGVWLYLRVTGRIFSWKETTSYLGMGDLAFWLVISLLLPLVNYVLFFLISLLIALLLGKIIFRAPRTIPLAGIQALVLWIVLCADSLYFQKGVILQNCLIP